MGDFEDFLEHVRAESAKEGPASEAAFEAHGRHFAFVNHLLTLRQARGWSQKELAKRSGIQQSEISRIESGNGNPTLQTLSALAGAYDCEIHLVPRAAKAATPAKKKPAARKKPLTQKTVQQPRKAARSVRR